MPESRRLPLSDKDEAALRDGQIDALLDDGLDRYFGGRYEEAIHLWTRVLFLDRSHARARAYIDRARTTLAELQRRSDEMLQASRDLLEQVRRWRAAVVVTDRDLPDGSWRDILHGMQDNPQRPLLIVASRHADGHLWAEVLNLGGYDVLAKPFDALEVQRVVGSACQRWSHRLALEQA